MTRIWMLQHLITLYSQRFHTMIIGTGDVPSSVGFYHSCGFVYSHRIENFFTENYDHPIIEDGVQLKDMIYLKRDISPTNILKSYHGRIPACGVFCGGCPSYTREKKPCVGAEINKTRCDKCKTFHLCCVGKDITHCYQCQLFPCTKFKGFANRWLKYGQNFIENQMLLKKVGEMRFRQIFNNKNKS